MSTLSSPRQKKTDKCITYNLTDGKQINTGYGRASLALGYVMLNEGKGHRKGKILKDLCSNRDIVLHGC